MVQSRVAMLAISFGAVGCGSSTSGGDAAPTDTTILGADPFEYTELGTSAFGAPEPTGYTLDATGMRITGSFVDRNPADYFSFATGSFANIDVQAYVDGTKQTEETYRATLTLDDPTDGYSTLIGDGYFIHAFIQPNSTFTLAIMSGDIATYVIEVRGS